MPPSANAGQAALEAIATEINELERLCVVIDGAISQRNWETLGEAIASSRRSMHALENAMEAAAPYRNQTFDEAAYARLREIFAYREERLNALAEIHDEIGTRLRQLSQWKSYARSVTTKDLSRRSAGLDSIR